MTHTITIEMRENCIERVEDLPKNWRLEVHQYNLPESAVGLSIIDNEPCMIYEVHPYRVHGTAVAPRLSNSELRLLHDCVRHQVVNCGIDELKSILVALENCLGSRV